MKCFYIMSLNVPFGFLVSLLGFIKGFSAAADCAENQSARASYLQLQIITFFLYIPFCFLHILVFAISNKFFPPDDKKKDDDGNETNELLYQSWLEKQHDMEEEEDDD